MTTARRALVFARERQLDWLLGEVLGTAAARGQAAAVRVRPWLAAALLALGLAAAFGTALLRDEPTPALVQEPGEAIEWHECHGPAQIDAIPADVVNLKCFDFDDAAMVHLGHFTKLLRLDLSGMDVNDRGYAVSLKITDAGLFHLNGVLQLRWLSLAGCHEVKGEGLRVLENLPQLEHLDLTYSGVESAAVERLNRLVSLRELSLSHCMNFHGRSLAEVAKIAGLRRLELRACTTLAADDVRHLARLTQLRYLDLRDCQGRFRGQRLSGFGPPDEEPPPPPVEDGIGITDASIAALADLKLETLLLGGAESLTDAIGTTLAKMTTLRHLDLSNLPKTTGSLLAKVPGELESLQLADNVQFRDDDLAQLPPLPGLRDLSLAGLANVGDAAIIASLAGKQLRRLSLRGLREVSKGVDRRPQPQRTGGVTEAIVAQRDLRDLDLGRSSWLDGPKMSQIAALPALERLDLTACTLPAGALARLAKSASLRSLQLTWCLGVPLDDLAAIGVQLRELDLYGTKLAANDIRAAAKAWPGCVIKLSDGQMHRAPR